MYVMGVKESPDCRPEPAARGPFPAQREPKAEGHRAIHMFNWIIRYLAYNVKYKMDINFYKFCRMNTEITGVKPNIPFSPEEKGSPAAFPRNHLRHGSHCTIYHREMLQKTG
jgi:hypothetical protein